MKYVILEAVMPTVARPWARISVDFEDGTPLYEKKMTADITSLDTIGAAVAEWWAYHEPNRAEELAKQRASSAADKAAIADAITRGITFAITNKLDAGGLEVGVLTAKTEDVAPKARRRATA